jgi:hypothetical protein
MKNQSAQRAVASRPGCRYAPVPVVINAYDPSSGKVTLTMRAIDERYEEIELVWHSHDVWFDCPSDLALTQGDSHNPAPRVGAAGTLYLLEQVVNAKALGWTPKWPDRGGHFLGEYRSLEILPTSVVVTGIESRSGRMVKGEIDLLDETKSSPYQTLVLGGASIKLELSQVGFSVFRLPFPGLATLKRIKGVLQNGGTPREVLAAWQQIEDLKERERSGLTAASGADASEVEGVISELMKLADTLASHSAALAAETPVSPPSAE